jgi:hypothetical protein
MGNANYFCFCLPLFTESEEGVWIREEEEEEAIGGGENWIVWLFIAFTFSPDVINLSCFSDWLRVQGLGFDDLQLKEIFLYSTA